MILIDGRGKNVDKVVVIMIQNVSSRHFPKKMTFLGQMSTFLPVISAKKGTYLALYHGKILLKGSLSTQTVSGRRFS